MLLMVGFLSSGDESANRRIGESANLETANLETAEIIRYSLIR